VEDRTIASFVAFVGGIFQAIAAILMIFSDQPSNLFRDFEEVLSSAYGISVQVIGSIGLLFSFFMLAGAIVMFRTGKVRLGSGIVITCSLLSLPFTLGGLLIGLIFGLMGGLFGYVSTKPDYSA
jgi:hypothetical protein